MDGISENPLLAEYEDALEPGLPIVDPHFHVWDIRPSSSDLHQPQRFLNDEAHAAIGRSGHNVTHTVFVECHAMHRKGGPPELRPVGETEFANGIAAMSASGNYGPTLLSHRIVGTANLLLGEAVRPVIEAHLRTAGERFRGIRFNTGFREEGMFGGPCDPAAKGAMREPSLREGARVLAQLDLTLDVWCFHTQLDEVIALADALPELEIVLDHTGGAPVDADDEAAGQLWRARMRELARRPNLRLKLGGLGMDLARPIGAAYRTNSSEILAAHWRPYMEHAIEAFTPQRCMFESNFPPDRAAGSYGAVWNAFKRIAGGASLDEKAALFSGTAARVYRIREPQQ